MIFGDHHVERWSVSAGARIPPGDGGDNPFDVDADLEGVDQVVAFTRLVEADEPLLQHD